MLPSSKGNLSYSNLPGLLERIVDDGIGRCLFLLLRQNEIRLLVKRRRDLGEIRKVRDF
jgi:hypothetical protein